LSTLQWDYPAAHIIEHTATSDEADGYGHINNSVYLNWLDQCVWDHCKAVAMPPETCRELNRGFAAVRHEIDYLAAAYPGDSVAIANWVTSNGGRLRAERRFQIIRMSDKKTLLRARSDYICTNLTNGRAARMPDIFKACFAVPQSLHRILAKASDDCGQDRPQNSC
jgi:acyl-CoA thioester hydrolase